MRPIRSMLFIPANRASWIERSPTFGADAIILDLEDSVPVHDKEVARKNAASMIASLANAGQRVYIRINRLKHIYDFDDILAVTISGTEGIMLPKVSSLEDIQLADALVGEAEFRHGLAPGSVVLAPVLETAGGVVKAYDIASHPRVASLVAASAKNGDVARSLGFQWTQEGLETIYMRSSSVAAARAAGKLAIGGLWQDVHDIAGLETWAKGNRQLGFHGELALHPSNVAVINKVYTPSDEEYAYYSRMIAAFEEAEKEGRGALIFEGDHVDLAHVETARSIIALYQEMNKK